MSRAVERAIPIPPTRTPRLIAVNEIGAGRQSTDAIQKFSRIPST